MARHDYDLPADYEKRIEEGTMSEWYEKERHKRQVMRQETPHTRNVESALERIKRNFKARSVKRRVDKFAEASQERVEKTTSGLIEMFNSAGGEDDVTYDPEEFTEEETESNSETSIFSSIIPDFFKR